MSGGETKGEGFALPQIDPAKAALDEPVRRIEVVVGDLTRPEPAWGVDVIVNAANESLLGGGGVDGAIHRAAGPELRAFNETLGGCPTGLAKVSPAFGLESRGVRKIIHTVGPVWRGEADTGVPGAPGDDTAKLGYTLEDTLLASCYLNCLRLAAGAEAEVVAFPGISTGVYRFPKERAAKIAFGHVFGYFAQRPAPAWPKRVVFCCFSEDDAAVYRRVIDGRSGWMTNRSRV